MQTETEELQIGSKELSSGHNVDETDQLHNDVNTREFQVEEAKEVNQDVVSEELREEEAGQYSLGFVRRVVRTTTQIVYIREVVAQEEQVRRVDKEYTVQSPSSNESFDGYLNFPSPSPVDKKQRKKRNRSDFEDDETESSQEIISAMSKKIKLLEDEIKKMARTQLKMQKETESLIKRNVKKATKPAIKKLGEATFKFEKAVGDQEKLQRMVNLQRVQYEEVTTKYEGVLDILDEQADTIDELRLRIKYIQEHVVSQSTWQLASDKDISLLPTI